MERRLRGRADRPLRHLAVRGRESARNHRDQAVLPRRRDRKTRSRPQGRGRLTARQPFRQPRRPRRPDPAPRRPRRPARRRGIAAAEPGTSNAKSGRKGLRGQRALRGCAMLTGRPALPLKQFSGSGVAQLSHGVATPLKTSQSFTPPVFHLRINERTSRVLQIILHNACYPTKNEAAVFSHISPAA